MKTIHSIHRFCTFAFGILILFWASSSCAQDPIDPGSGVTIQLPVVGVSVNAEGVLTTKSFADPRRELMNARRDIRRRQMKPALQKPSKLRKISLRKLDAAINQLRLAGELPDDEMQNLAGITRIKFVFVLPDENDIVIAGPAEGWMKDLSGRSVGITSGKPIVLLEDLVTAIRAYDPPPGIRRWVGCSIDPTPQGIQNLTAFQKTIPAQIPNWARAQVTRRVAKGLQDSLGLAQIRVYGVHRRTNLAQVMVESDYRMKLIAVGREPAPVRMTTFIDALKGAPRDMQRWWFTPNYECLAEAKDGLAMQLVGQGVQLSTENIQYTQQAQIIQTGTKPSSAAKKYASEFTKKYEQIAQAAPVFGQLRNMIDLLVAGAWMKKQDAFERCEWRPTCLLDEDRLATQKAPDAKTAQSVSNAIWKQNVLILPAGGGVSISVSQSFTAKNRVPLDDRRVELKGVNFDWEKARAWWWD